MNFQHEGLGVSFQGRMLRKYERAGQKSGIIQPGGRFTERLPLGSGRIWIKKFNRPENR
jgi:hypothetical protein